MATLRDKVALVTGASRGVGKGVALGLAEAGATIYITGRSVEEGQGVGGAARDHPANRRGDEPPWGAWHRHPLRSPQR